jgi:hypothetical protein
MKRPGRRERLLIAERKRWARRCQTKANAVKDDMPDIRLSCQKRNPVNASPKHCNGQGWKWNHSANTSVRRENRM